MRLHRNNTTRYVRTYVRRAGGRGDKLRSCFNPFLTNSFSISIFMQLQLYRHSMTQFMNALHNYLTCSVLHASWTEFEKDLENSATIDHIYMSHINYIKRILSR